jgi:heme-degrading monooxygenase HmoA
MIVDQVTFRVKSGREQEFEAQQQEWTALMRRARGFINQVLLRSLENPAEYHAEVRWVNREYRDRFSAEEDRENKALAQKRSVLLDGPPSHRLLESI